MRRQRDLEPLPNLGDLEADIMNVLWDLGSGTVQDVLEALTPRRALAYTTVMTVMTRLTQKGYLSRRREGRSFVYTPATSREQVAESALGAVVQRLYQGATGKAIAHLLELEAGVDDEELARLEALIRAKRKGTKP